MFALVRFVQDADNRLHIIPVEDIANFHPNNEDDFDSRTTYSAYWHDDDGENNGLYVAQILKLAATKELMNEKMRSKRVAIPKLNASDVSDIDTDKDVEEDASSTRKHLRAEGKKKRQNRATAKKIQFRDVLREHVQHALEANSAVTKQAESRKANSRSQPVPKPGTSSVPDKLDIAEVPTASCSYNEKREKRPRLPSDTSTSSDDCLVSSAELQKAQKEAKFWKQQFRLQENHTATLRERVRFLEKTLETQLTALQNTIADFKKSQIVVDPPEAPVNCHQNDVASEDRNQADLGTPPSNQKEGAAAAALPTENTVNPGLDEEPAPFCATSDGRFHLCGKVFATQEQARKLFKNKKPSILVRDAAHVIWGPTKLAQRSVSGRLAPTKSATDEVALQQLTPAKLDVVYACLAHWGQLNNSDTTVAASNVPRILSEKIQDVKKKLKLAKA